MGTFVLVVAWIGFAITFGPPILGAIGLGFILKSSEQPETEPEDTS